MNQPSPNQLKTENRFPDCVLMKLHSAPVQLEESPSMMGNWALQALKKIFTVPTTAKSVATTGEIRQVSLKLTIRFYKQRVQVPGGQVEFGLKRGELNLKLTNGRIPVEKIGLTVPFKIEVEVEEQQEKGRESELNVAVAGGVKVKDSIKTGTKTKTRLYRVTNRGTEENPIWEFAMEPNLTGQLTEEPLGTIERNGEPCSVEATFLVKSQSDLELFNSTGLLKAKRLSRNKTAWATREFFLRFIVPKLQPYLSRVEGQL